MTLRVRKRGIYTMRTKLHTFRQPLLKACRCFILGFLTRKVVELLQSRACLLFYIYTSLQASACMKGLNVMHQCWLFGWRKLQNCWRGIVFDNLRSSTSTSYELTINWIFSQFKITQGAKMTQIWCDLQLRIIHLEVLFKQYFNS